MEASPSKKQRANQGSHNAKSFSAEGVSNSSAANGTAESEHFTLPKPSGASQYHASYQAQLLKEGKIRSKSHVRSEGLSQYSPCPKIPLAAVESQENHYSLNIGSNPLAPLPNSDEKV